LFSLRQFFYDRYKSLESAEHRLLYLFLEITRQCKLSCRHCGSDCRADLEAPVLSAESWFSIVDSVSSRFSRDLCFVITGGEPLIHPAISEIGRRISDNHRAWGIVTNGLRLDNRMMDRLVDSGMRSITVSLDGGREAHNYLRNNPDAFDRAMAALRIVGRSGIPFRDAVSCVYPGNLDALPSMADALLELRIPRWRLFRIFPNGRARDNPDLLLSHAQSWRLVEWIRDNRTRYRRWGLTIDYSCEGWFPFSLDRQIRTEPFFCRAGVSIASILCDGSITGCPNNCSAFTQGNIGTDDFATIWETGFTLYRNRSWMKTGFCSHCPHFSHCQGGSLHLRADNDSPPAFCPMRASR